MTLGPSEKGYLLQSCITGEGRGGGEEKIGNFILDQGTPSTAPYHWARVSGSLLLAVHSAHWPIFSINSEQYLCLTQPTL